MKLNRLKKTTITSIACQIVTVICGFIFSKLIILHYGSAVNGLVSSITQFLTVITFLEMGMGSVVRSSLYKPLAEHDDRQISRIATSAGRFFKKIAIILLIYTLGLLVIFPTFINHDFDFFYTALLIAAISLNYFSQYYFGMVDRLLLTADQRGYVQYSVIIITLIVNTVLCAILILAGASIQMVKLVTSALYLIRPYVMRKYVNRHYRINRNERYTEEPIKQKWNGVAQHVAACVLDGTDTIILTIFSTLENVSIYSVYYMVVNGVKQFLLGSTTGIQSLLGELWAKKQLDDLNHAFGNIEWIIHNCVVIIFGCTGTLILPFVQIYTQGTKDAAYFQPVFAVLLVAANAAHCLRIPYYLMIMAAGHFKQTQGNYVVAVAINICISIVTVMKWGLIGVALGTLAAMTYQTIWMAVYDSRNIIKWPIHCFVKQCAADFIIVILGSMLCRAIPIMNYTYPSWVIHAFKIGCLWLLCVFLVNLILFRPKLVEMGKAVLKKLPHH